MSATPLADKALWWLTADTDVEYEPTDADKLDLQAAMELMQDDGVEWTDETLMLFVCGDQVEAAETLGHRKGFPRADETLHRIWAGE